MSAFFSIFGDLHTHTVHSDGNWDVPGLLAGARQAGPDFLAITDHNTVSHLAGLGENTGQPPLVVAGMDLTIFRGHALGLGTRRWIYPEERESRAPGTQRVFEVFANLEGHRLTRSGRLLWVFQPELSTLQHKIPRLLRIRAEVFRSQP